MERSAIGLLLVATVAAADPPIVDPYPLDRPLFTVTPATLTQHADRLAAGHRALLEKYPDYAMPVYATRHSVTFPDAVNAATAANANRARLRGADAIEGARLGIPFPRPRTGVEILWNHRLRYRGDATQWHYQRATVWPDGERQIDHAVEDVLFRYANLRAPADLEAENVHSYNRLAMEPCEDQSDLLVLWHEPVNALAAARKVWGGPTGADTLNAMRRYGPVGYDEVGLCSHKIRYFDMVDMFNGPFDRYTFKLVGQRELYAPYNAYRLSDARNKVADLLRPGHFRQNDARYELRRVWVVEASLRAGAPHKLAKRVFYVDEDSWSVLLVDCYDGDGRLSRFQEGHLVALAPIQAVDYAPMLTYDLKDGRYFADRLLSESSAPRLQAALPAGDFSPTHRDVTGVTR